MRQNLNLKNPLHEMILVLTQVMNDAGCLACQEGFHIMYKSLEKGITRDGVIGVLELICKQLPNPTMKEQCNDFIETEYDKLIAWLEVAYSEKIICTLIGACDFPIDPINSACDGCLVAFTFLEDLWSFGGTEEWLEWVLDLICEMFPAGSSWKDECKAFINQEFEKLIEWIDNAFPPKFICTIIGVCDFPIEPHAPVCDVCEVSFQFIFDLIDFDIEGGNELIHIVLDYMCYIFPANSSARDQCIDLIEKEYDHIVEFIENQFNPQFICVLVDACKSPIDPEKCKTECDLCKVLFKTADDMTVDNAPTIDIQFVLDFVCDFFPDEVTPRCKDFVRKHNEELIKFIKQNATPQAACTGMGACN